MADIESVPFLNDQVTVIVRSVGERTEAACVASIQAQGITKDAIVITNEAPFSKAMRVGFEAGLEAARPWTLCVDADVILRRNAIACLLEHARRQPGNVCEIQGLALDKFIGSLREVGNHLYRTAHLSQLIEIIPEEGTHIRPECYTLQQAETLGLTSRGVPYVVGIHDFAQFDRDIFRKCFVHAHKHLNDISAFLPDWRRRAETDPDYQIALEGLAGGLSSMRKVFIDIKFEAYEKRFTALRIKEKEPLELADLTPACAEEILVEWAESGDIKVRRYPVTPVEAIALDGRSRFTRMDKIRGYLRLKARETGMLRVVPYAIGAGLEQLGQALKRRMSSVGSSRPP